MIERPAIDFAAGRSRIFISGAMLPNGCAASVQEVFEAMFQRLLDAFACLEG